MFGRVANGSLIAIAAWACSQVVTTGIGAPPAFLDQVRARLASPTGVWDQNTRDAVIEAAKHNERVVVALARLVEYVASRLRALAKPSGTDTAGLASISSPLEAVGWVRIACPGEDMASPSTDFSRGEVRADLGAEVADAAQALSGYVRLALKSCVVQTDRLDGVAHTLFQSEGVVASLSLRDTVGGEVLGEFSVDALLSDEEIEFLVDHAGATFTIGISSAGDPTTLVVRAANGSWTCRTDTGSCDVAR